MISNFFLKSMRSSFLGSRFFLDPILSLIWAAVMFRLSPSQLLWDEGPWAGRGREGGLDLMEEGSGLGVERGLEPEVVLLPKGF